MQHANKISRLVSNAQRLNHQTQVLAAAIHLTCGGRVNAASLCCWCGEHEPGQAYRTIGGDCDRCSYSGRDCFVVVK